MDKHDLECLKNEAAGRLADEAMALAAATGTDEPYLDLLEAYLHAFAAYKREAGEIDQEFTKHVAAELYRRMGTPLELLGDADRLPAYREAYLSLVRDIDDVILRWARGSGIIYVLDLYALKYDCRVEDLYDASRVKGNAWRTVVGDYTLTLRTLDRLNKALILDFISVHNGYVRIELHSGFLEERARHLMGVECLAGEKVVEGRFVRRSDQPKNTLFPEFDTCLAGYVIDVPWDGDGDLTLRFRVRFKKKAHPATLQFAKFVALNKELPASYWDVNGALMRYVEDADGAALSIVKSTRARRIAAERSLQREILATHHQEALELCGWRRLGFLAREERYQSRQQIWLISDRPVKAGDNGEALFTYLCKHPLRGVKVYFVLSHDSADWDRISQIGPTVDLRSRRYRHLFLRATHVLSSSGEEWSLNAFGPQRQYVKDLYGFKSVFLQHGIIKNDLSGWLNRYNKNFTLMISGAESETASLRKGNYAYGSDAVAFTGLPRYDGLIESASNHASNKAIYLMPTWRKRLIAGAYDVTKGQYPPNPRFAESNYFVFYQALISDERLLRTLRSHGYLLRFVMHPSFVQEADKFVGNDVVEVLARCDYRDAFVDGAMFVTDYSSVSFDVALLKKPVVYAHFDEDTFYVGHSFVKGYYDDLEDGFGPVCHTLEETVDAIIAFVEDGCVMPEKYRARVDAFFGEQPTSRCKAVVAAIQSL